MRALLFLSVVVASVWFVPFFAEAGTIAGEIRYTDKVYTLAGRQADKYLPVPYAKVQLYRVTGTEVDDVVLIATSNLNRNGMFSFTVSSGQLGANALFQIRLYSECTGGTPNPIRVLTLAPASEVFSIIFRGAALETDASGDWTGDSGTTTTKGTLTVSEDNSGPFNIMFCVARATEVVAGLEGGTFPPTATIRWEPGSTRGTYAESISQEIFLLGDPTRDSDEFDDDVIIHEFGHVVSYNYTQEDSPGGYHYGAVTDMRLAWTEAWSGYFAAWVRSHIESEIAGTAVWHSTYIDTRASGQVAWDIEPPSASGFPGVYANDEISVQSGLWDILDPANEGWDLAFDIPGGLSGEEAVWNVYRSFQGLPASYQITVEHFWEQWFALGYGNSNAMFSIFADKLLMDFEEDVFENDDLAGSATVVTSDGTATRHTFYPAGDNDWLTFSVVSGKQYTVTTSELVNGADTVVTVYAQDTSTILISNDNRNTSSRESLAVFTPDYTGSVFVKVSQTSSKTYARFGGYKVSVVAGDGTVDPPPVTTGGGGGGCFISTAAFGGLAADAVVHLTTFRDGPMETAATGTQLVGLYYSFSPTVARRMHGSASAVLRRLLD